MKHKILKTALVIGLMTASSLALSEGKYAIRFPAQGVDANPTFSMTEAEKQDYLGLTESERQEYLQNKENRETCASETNDTSTMYNRSGGTYYVDSLRYVRYGYNAGYIPSRRSTAYKINGETVSGDQYKIGSFNDEETKIYLRDDAYSRDEKIVSKYYEIIIESKTEKYDWCVDNGYQTAN